MGHSNVYEFVANIESLQHIRCGNSFDITDILIDSFVSST